MVRLSLISSMLSSPCKPRGGTCVTRLAKFFNFFRKSLQGVGILGALRENLLRDLGCCSTPASRSMETEAVGKGRFPRQSRGSLAVTSRQSRGESSAFLGRILPVCPVPEPVVGSGSCGFANIRLNAAAPSARKLYRVVVGTLGQIEITAT